MYHKINFVDSDLKDLISEYELELAKAGVELEDEDLQDEINAHFYNLESAILAILEASSRGKLEHPNRYLTNALKKGWKPRNGFMAKTPSYPVRTAADFDLGQTDEERAANYRRLRQMTIAIASEFSSNTGGKKAVKYHQPEFFSRCPTLEQVRAAWSIPAFRAEVEKALASHQYWGYAIVNGEIQEVEF